MYKSVRQLPKEIIVLHMYGICKKIHDEIGTPIK